MGQFHLRERKVSGGLDKILKGRRMATVIIQIGNIDQRTAKLMNLLEPQSDGQNLGDQILDRLGIQAEATLLLARETGRLNEMLGALLRRRRLNSMRDPT